MTEVTERTIDPMYVAFLAMEGDYSMIADGYPKLYDWVIEQEMAPIGPPMAVFLSDPLIVSPEGSKWELWAPVSGPLSEREANEEGLGVKIINGGLVAAAVHVGRYDEVSRTYNDITEWLATNDKTIVGPHIEVYLSDPAEVPEDQFETELWFPIEG